MFVPDHRALCLISSHDYDARDADSVGDERLLRAAASFLKVRSRGLVLVRTADGRRGILQLWR